MRSIQPEFILRSSAWMLSVCALLLISLPLFGSYTNFESGQVHPIALSPSSDQLAVLNTPDGVVEFFQLLPDGRPVWSHSVPVGLEPVSLGYRSAAELWVVNQLSDSVSIVDVAQRRVVQTLAVGDEPTDIAFAGSRAFVSVAQFDRLDVFDLGDLSAPPVQVPLTGRKPRALAVSADQATVYAVVLFSGNQTTAISAEAIFGLGAGHEPTRLSALGVRSPTCTSTPPNYPPLPSGITRNPTLVDPVDGVPRVGLILGWDPISEAWVDDAGQDWSACAPYRVQDHDLFKIDVATLQVSTVAHLGTSLFDVSVQPQTGKIWVPNTDARNRVRFEHPLGVQGHVVDNQLTIVAPDLADEVTRVDLNTHIDRNSDPSSNLAERQASVSQPGMMAWESDGNRGYLTSFGSGKLFRLDGQCDQGSCIFGADRSQPESVNVGPGPSGVSLHPTLPYAYVLNRFDQTLAWVDRDALQLLETLPMHDPTDPLIQVGRELFYDGVGSSAHGDAACSSCHLFGDRDDLAWDLGDPEGEFVPYGQPGDNVRFVLPQNDVPIDCPPSLCASHQGFDPQKGPMTTQTLRGMLEPLHWRGDRGTVNAFNPAFVGLLGKADVDPGVERKGLSDADMELFRQFTLGIAFPPNPNRNLDDSLPNVGVPVTGTTFIGNPTIGELVFDTAAVDAGQPCSSCHAHPFGAAGGKLGGLEAGSPIADRAALFNGDADQSFHSDLKVAHLRNIYEKVGPVFGTPATPELVRSGFGLAHDGSSPDLGTFFSFAVFTMTPQQVRDVSAFVTHFPTGTRPAVGAQVTVPAGDNSGNASQEARLATLLSVGDLASVDRHCELTVSYERAGEARRALWQGGAWVEDLAGAATRTTPQLRDIAEGPLTFTCVPLDAGLRVGADRDGDGFLNGNDCADTYPGSWAEPQAVDDLRLAKLAGGQIELSWQDQASWVGGDVRYRLLFGDLQELRAGQLATTATCLADAFADVSFVDPTLNPSPGQAHFFLLEAHQACGNGGFGVGREALDSWDCDLP